MLNHFRFNSSGCSPVAIALLILPRNSSNYFHQAWDMQLQHASIHSWKKWFFFQGTGILGDNFMNFLVQISKFHGAQSSILGQIQTKALFSSHRYFYESSSKFHNFPENFINDLPNVDKFGAFLRFFYEKKGGKWVPRFPLFSTIHASQGAENHKRIFF